MFVDASAILKLVSGAVEVKRKFLAEMVKSLVSLQPTAPHLLKDLSFRVGGSALEISRGAFSTGLIREVKMILASKSGKGFKLLDCSVKIIEAPSRKKLLLA